MSLVEPFESPQERAWSEGEAATIAAMGAINVATAALVGTIGMLLDTGGWEGWGIASIDHWVSWKADVSRHRALGLVAIARRRAELPVSWGFFQAGRLTEDAMVRIARRVPSSRDAEVAELAMMMTIPQLSRILSSLPELPDPDERAKADPERHLYVGTRRDGWVDGRFSLPADEGALVMAGLTAARDAEFHDRNDLAVDVDLPAGTSRAGITWADALVRMASEACDGLDRTFQRTGHRGERNQVIIHRQLDPDGTLGPARLHLGGFIPDPVARYLGCDAQVVLMEHKAGRLIGITPTDRTPSRRVRRYLEQRDGGCAHPLCQQKRWLHAHHIVHWEHGGSTTPENLLCLCPTHHRALHQGDFTIAGNPEDRSLVFSDRRGRRIEPPGFARPGAPPTAVERSEVHPYRPPSGERLDTKWFDWN